MKKAVQKKITRLKRAPKKNSEKISESEVLEVQEEKNAAQVESLDKKKEAISAVDNAIAQLEHDSPPEAKTPDNEVIPVQTSEEPDLSTQPVTSEPEVDEFEAKKPKMFSSSEEQLPRVEKNNKKLFVLGTVVFIVTVVVTAGVGFAILQSSDNVQKEKVEEESQVVVPTVEPTVAVLQREDWVFEVLNGSGKSGEAARARTKLEALGYEVESVGNAKENVSTTQIFVPEGAPDTTALFEDLEKDFGKLSVSGVLDEDSKATIRIVLGSE